MNSYNTKDGLLLLKIARDTITHFLFKEPQQNYEIRALPPALLLKAGAHIKLLKKTDLRAYVGQMPSELPLYEVVIQTALKAAQQDYRFEPIRIEELPQMRIELSVISPLQRIININELNPDIHGIYLRKNGKSGAYLPLTAKQNNWTKEELLGHCARDKAKIEWDDWKTAEIYLFTTKIFRE
jgi:MEMO1 family protein